MTRININAETERALFEEYKQNPTTQNEEKLLKQFKGLVPFEMRRMNCTTHRDEVYQVGMIALLKAIRKYDLDLGYRFSTLACSLIRGYIRNYYRDYRNALHPIRWTLERISELRKTEQALRNRLHREPTEREIAEQMHLTDKQMRQIGQLEFALRVPDPIESIGDDPPLSSNGRLMLASCKNNSDVELMCDHLLRALRPNEQEVLKMQFLEGMTQEAIGKTLGCSKSNIGMISKRAIGKLKKYIYNTDTHDLFSI